MILHVAVSGYVLTFALLLGGFQKIYQYNIQASDLKFRASLLRHQLNYLIQSPMTWKLTVEKSGTGECNATLSCIKNGTDCALALPKANQWSNDKEVNCLYGWNGQIFFNGTQPHAGFNFRGEPCDSFDLAAPNSACALRPKIIWRSTCSTPPCTNRPVEVRQEVMTSAPGTPLNGSKLALNFIRL